MDEYKIRGEIIEFVKSRIKSGIDDYHNFYSGDIMNLLIYPLISLEKCYENNRPESITAAIQRHTVGWILEQNHALYSKLSINTITNDENLQIYQNNIHNVLENIMQDSRTLLDIQDGNSFAKSKIVDKCDGRYHLITSLVTDKYFKEKFYYYGLGDVEAQKADESRRFDGLNEIFLKYMPRNKADLRKLKRLNVDIDQEMLAYCEDNVYSDLVKLGENTRSPVLPGINDTKKILAFIYYLALSKHVSNHIMKIVTGKDETALLDYLVIVDKQWVIDKIVKIYGLHKDKVKRLIDYWIFGGKGNLSDFPLIEVGDVLITIPSLLQLNDFHFTLANGHYIRGIQFQNSDRTIARTIGDELEKKIRSYTNVLIAREFYYECMIEGKKTNSDIDFAIYDVESNSLLVIEAKWKFNHYHNGLDEQFVKVQNSLNKIFKQQLSKHVEFLKDNDSIKKLFGDNGHKIPSNVKNIFYLAVDKRNQLSINGNHMTTLYTLLFLMDEHTTDGILSLDLLIKELQEFETKVEYIVARETTEFSVSEDITLESDDLCLQYNFI